MSRRAAGTALAAALAVTVGLLAPGIAAAADNASAPRPEASPSPTPALSGDDASVFEDGSAADGSEADAPASDAPSSDAPAAETPEAPATEKPDQKPQKPQKPADDAPVTADDTTADEEPDLPPPPVPAAPADLPAAVDALANYQGQGICDPTPKKGTQSLADLIKSTYGSLAYSVWIPRDCSIGGRSEHKEGRAIDWMIDRRVKEERRTANAFIDWLLATDENGNEFAMARRLGIMYIGWDDRIWESYTQKWTELKGCFSTPEPGYDNYCHRNHIHLSLSWDGAAGQTSFWGGTPTPAPFCNRWATASAEALPVGNGLDFVPTKPQRVLNTRTGRGLPGDSPCRLTQNSGGGPGAPVSLRVADLPRAPKEGVRAVAVRTITVGSNSPAQLRARTFDGATIAPIKVNGRTSAITIVPVGSDGTIAFTTDSGATHLLVDVLGYFVKPAAAQGNGGPLQVAEQVTMYDSADDTVLGPGEKRIITVATDDSFAQGALIAVTMTNAERGGSLIVREQGTKRTIATPVLKYRQDDTSTQTVLTGVNKDGEIVLVNKGKGALDIAITVQAATSANAADGSLLVPVAPTEITGRRTSMHRVLRDAKGSQAVVVQVDAKTPKQAAKLMYWSGTLTPVTLDIGRKTTQSSLIVVPLSDSGLIMREVVGGSVDVTARIVGYLR